jgi:DNA-binding NarL/FixJ family response regulator
VNVIAEAADVGSPVVAVRTHRPRIVLLDDAAGSHVRILLLSSDRAPGLIRHVMRAGAAGYVLPEAANNDVTNTRDVRA